MSTSVIRILSICSFAVIIIALSSCKSKRVSEAEKVIQEWQGREIVLPANASFCVVNRDSVTPVTRTPDNADYKIVSYVDSIGCMSCKLQLGRWREYLKELDSISDGKVSAYFYFEPARNKINDLRIEIIRNRFSHPVCIDTLGLFNTQNKFPESDAYHVMLLDKDNKVIALGNPVLNPDIKSLYDQIITQTEMTKEVAELTTISVVNQDFDFGEIRLGEPAKCQFNIKNTGKTALLVKDVITSCDCVVAKASSNEIKPQDELVIDVELTPDETGEFMKDVFVYCNIEDSPIELHLSGTVK